MGMVMDQYQESVLTGGGDCFIHWHSADRVVDHNKLLELQQVMKQVTAPATYTVTHNDDVILCPIATTLTFPLAGNGREIEVVMTGTGNVTVNFSGTDAMYGNTSVLLNTQGMALHFKAVVGGWILV